MLRVQLATHLRDIMRSLGFGSQQAVIRGDKNVVVQVNQSKDVQITVQAQADGPLLELLARHRLARIPKKYLDLLNPISCSIPMLGRDREQRALESWLYEGPGISARCLVGGTGSGKTRLALELCAAADKRGWFAGFIDLRELLRFRSQQNLSAWDWPKPTLIVVDYAAAKARILRDWLAELVQHQGGSAKPLRLLLLERHAYCDLGWWPELTRPRAWAEEGLHDLFNPPEPIPLGNITEIEHRRQILESVMAAASTIKGLNKPLRPPMVGEDPAFDRRLADPDLEFAPLHLLMAGILGVEHRLRTPLLVLGPTAMAKQLADLELGRIDNFSHDRGLSHDFLRHLAVGVTLVGGLSRDDLAQVIAEEGQACGFTDAMPEVEHTLIDVLSSEQPNQIAPIIPDLVGEAAVIRVIGALAPKKQAEAIKRWHMRAPSLAVSGIIRIIQDYATNDNHVALQWFDTIVAGTNDPIAFMGIADQMPEKTVVLGERAAQIYAAIVAILQSTLGTPGDQSTASVLARSLNNLANRLSELGQREQALERAQEAVQLYRELAATRPDAFRPDLARSLNNLAAMLSELGQREQALERAQEAVDIRRELAATRPDAFRPDLAASLNNLAAMLSELGQREQALERAQEAVQLYRELAATRPDAFPQTSPGRFQLWLIV
jgi:Tetratricopeptide repeat